MQALRPRKAPEIAADLKDFIFRILSIKTESYLHSRAVVQFVRHLDGSRPVTLVLNKHSNVDVAVSLIL